MNRRIMNHRAAATRIYAGQIIWKVEWRSRVVRDFFIRRTQLNIND